MKVITNNQKVEKKYVSEFDLEFINGEYLDVLICVRNYIHEGYVLLTHPLSGSIKPGETPFKSILITEGYDDFKSEILISDAIRIAEKMIRDSKKKSYTEKMLDDFSLVDLDVITSGIESHKSFGINASR